MLAELLTRTLDERHLSVRKAAQEIGVSHTTLHRLLSGGPADLSTLERVAAWLGLPLGKLLEKTQEGENVEALIEQIRSLSPELGRLLAEIQEEIAAGRVTEEVLRDVALFAAYRLNLPRRQHGPHYARVHQARRSHYRSHARR